MSVRRETIDVFRADGDPTTGDLPAAHRVSAIWQNQTTGDTFDWDAVNGWVKRGDSGGGGVSAVTATSPIVSSGGTTPDISLPASSATSNGYMSKEDKSKLDGVEAGATASGATGDAFASSHPGTGGSSHANATTSVAGFMSGADKTKLNSLPNITVGTTAPSTHSTNDIWVDTN